MSATIQDKIQRKGSLAKAAELGEKIAYHRATLAATIGAGVLAGIGGDLAKLPDPEILATWSLEYADAIIAQTMES